METISLAIYWNGSQPFSQTGIREGSYWGRHDDHLNVVTLKWSEGSIISHPWIREQWACLFVRGCITPGMINVPMLWWSQWDMSRVMGDGQCLGATGHAGSSWWPMPIDIWYHSFHSQHSHIINVSNPHLYSPALQLSWHSGSHNIETKFLSSHYPVLMLSLSSSRLRL